MSIKNCGRETCRSFFMPVCILRGFLPGKKTGNNQSLQTGFSSDIVSFFETILL